MNDCLEDKGVGLATLAAPTRNLYPYGKLLDTYHLELEQAYLNRKRWLLNRLVTGAGVVCGLSVNPSSDGTHVQVASGLALDSLGREIVVPSASPPIDPRQPTDACGRPFGERIAGAGTVTLCLSYHECPAEPVPLLAGACEAERTCAASLVRERYRLVVRNGAPAVSEPVCTRPDLFARDDHGTLLNLRRELADVASASCSEPATDVCVVLARIGLPADGGAFAVDPSLRPVVKTPERLFDMLVCLAGQAGGAQVPPPPGPTLTRIQELSWTHDGVLSVADFEKGLHVTFTTGVTARAARGGDWFVVTVAYPEPSPPGTVAPERHIIEDHIDIEPDGVTATFVPTRDLLGPSSNGPGLRELLQGQAPHRALVRVVLKCNFLLDKAGRCVDGDFLAKVDAETGKWLPSGDGVAGGDFESWFMLEVNA